MRAPCGTTWLTWHSQAPVVCQGGRFSVAAVVRMVVTHVGLGGTRPSAFRSVACSGRVAEGLPVLVEVVEVGCGLPGAVWLLHFAAAAPRGAVLYRPRSGQR